MAGKKVQGARPDDTRELLNYKKAFDLVSDYLESRESVTEALIRQIHKRLVPGVRGNKASPGEYRKIQNYIVNSRTGEKIYTPCPPLEVPQMMTDFVAWLQKETQINSVIVAGVAQFQLVHIHPFVDGNGRSARLLSTRCLYRTGYDFKRLFTISEYYDGDRPDEILSAATVTSCDKLLRQALTANCDVLASAFGTQRLIRHDGGDDFGGGALHKFEALKQHSGITIP